MFTDTRRIAPKPSKRQLTQIDNQINAIYCRTCSGIQINVMDISKVFAAGRAAALAGEPIEPAIVAIVAQLRQN